MPPPMQRFGGGPNNIAAQHYQQYNPHAQSHVSGLPPPSLGGNHSFMNPNSAMNAFATQSNPLSLGQGFGGGAGMGAVTGTGLGSREAQMSFAHGASLQNQQAHNGMNDVGARMANKARGVIREVWKGNLHQEMDTLRKLVERYPYISMDTEFPGVVARPMGSFRGKSDYHYQTLRSNVDILNLIQVGITLFSEDGETIPQKQGSDGKNMFPSTWQFNFRFSLAEDMYSEASIQSLVQAGVDFKNHETQGIDPFEFSALLISSGLVCDDDVRWISFHGGYDFGYLTKLMIAKPLPDDEVEFDMLMKKFFPSIYDVKYLMKHAIKQLAQGTSQPPSGNAADMLYKFDQKSSLESLGEVMKIKRTGPAHQGGSDALLTGRAFFQMRKDIYGGDIPDEHIGKVWGLGFPDHGNSAFANSTPQHYNQTNENTPSNGAFTSATPSTPNNAHVGLASTPSHATVSSTIGSLTPGGGGGAFGHFQYK